MIQAQGGLGPKSKRQNGQSSLLFVDGAFVVVLGAIGILGFRATYGGWAFLLIGTFALVLGVAISELVRRLEKPLLLEFAISIVAFFLLGGLVALRGSQTGSAFPTLATISALFSTGFRGWKELLTLKPPIGNAAGLLTIPYFIGLFGGMTGYGTARRTKSVVLPVLVPLAILALGILFGTDQSVALYVQGSVFAGLVLAWMSIRSHYLAVQLKNDLPKKNYLLLGAVVLGAGVLSPLLSPILPGNGHQRVVLSSYVTPPINSNLLSSPLVAFRSYTKGAPRSLSNTVLFKVAGLNTGSLLRIATMDTYNGLVWGFGTGAQSSSTVQGQGDQFYRYGSTIPTTVTGQQGEVTINIVKPIDSWLPTIGQLSKISFLGPQSSLLASEFRYDATTGTAIDNSILNGNVQYKESVVVPPTPTTQELNGAIAGSQPMDVVVPSAIQAQAAKWVSNANGAWAKVLAIAGQLKSRGRYSNGTEDPPLALPGESAGRLDSFISGNPLVGKYFVGDDEQFAATLALMANSVGVPARVVLGASVPKGGVIVGQDVHAWVEVELNGFGWVNVPPSLFLATQPPAHVLNKVQPLSQSQIVIAPPTLSILAPATSYRLPQSAAPSSRLLQKTVKPGFKIPVYVIYIGEFAGGPLLAIFAVMGLIATLKYRRRKMRRTSGSLGKRLAGAWWELLDMAHDLGYSFPKGMTRLEQANALLASNVDVVNFANGIDSGIFGIEEPSNEEVNNYWSELSNAVKGLSGSVGRRKRILAKFRIGTLLRTRKAL